MIDFKLNFARASERLIGEADERRDLAQRLMPFNIGFLDDIARGILPHDLILFCAWSGAGKTQIVSNIAQRAARDGRRVHFFALEAEPREIERRMKYRALAERVWQAGTWTTTKLTYVDWYLGRCDELIAPHEAEVDREIAEHYSGLFTYYRGSRFDTADLERTLMAIRDQTDLIVLDHVHYVDGDDDNENQSLKQLVKTIRDASLSLGVPVIVVAHLRKRDRGRRQIVPELDDVHGTSDIVKVATKVIMLAPALDQPDQRPWIASTYVSVAKDRIVGATGLVALAGYDIRTASYEPGYQLGRIVGDKWQPLEPAKRPTWATGAA